MEFTNWRIRMTDLNLENDIRDLLDSGKTDLAILESLYTRYSHYRAEFIQTVFDKVKAGCLNTAKV